MDGVTMLVVAAVVFLAAAAAVAVAVAVVGKAHRLWR